MSKDAIVSTDNFAALSETSHDMTFAEVIEANYGDEGIAPRDLPVIKIPSGGGLQWETQSASGPVHKESIDGIIVAMRNPRFYYENEFDGTAVPPSCYSPDGKYGEPREQAEGYGGNCKECPKGQWGSARVGGGQACSKRKMLLILQPNSMLPVVVSISPGSIPNMKNYLGRLSAEWKPHYAVVTGLSLEKAKSGSGITYSRVVPKHIRNLTDEEVAMIKAYRAAVIPAFDQVESDEATKSGDVPF